MSLQLTESNRQSNCYFREIDNLSNTVTQVDNAFNIAENKITDIETSIRSVNSVKYYGAVGNGLTDDTIAIKACIAANGDRIIIPNGVYRITSELVFSNKNRFTLMSESAEILQDFTTPESRINKSSLVFNDCDYFRTEGTLILTTTSTVDITAIGLQGTTYETYPMGSALKMVECDFCMIANITIRGKFYDGIQIAKNNGREVNININSVIITDCVYGIRLLGEYIIISNSVIQYCRTGVHMVSGSNTLSTTNITRCRIGVHVKSNNNYGDRGKINDCIINHHSACGIFFNGIFRNMEVTACEFWVTRDVGGGLMLIITPRI